MTLADVVKSPLDSMLLMVINWVDALLHQHATLK
jgi:hypothetical protein